MEISFVPRYKVKMNQNECSAKKKIEKFLLEFSFRKSQWIQAKRVHRKKEKLEFHLFILLFLIMTLFLEITSTSLGVILLDQIIYANAYIHAEQRDLAKQQQ